MINQSSFFEMHYQKSIITFVQQYFFCIFSVKRENKEKLFAKQLFQYCLLKIKIKKTKVSFSRFKSLGECRAKKKYLLTVEIFYHTVNEEEEKIEGRRMDPLKLLCPELFDLIFQHLTPKELMQKSFVSKTWHGEIGNSQNMKRIKLFVYESAQDELNKSLMRLFSSKRGYRNVSVNLGTMAFDEKVEQFARKCNIKYRNVKYSDAKICDSLWPIECVAKTVESISLCNIVANFELKLTPDYDFPNLTDLTIYQNSNVVNECFKNCKNLKLLDYTEHKLNDSKLIETLLINNSAIKSLSLRIFKCGSALQSIIPKCKFKLEKFSFNSYRLNDRMSNENRDLLCEILLSQKNWIQRLILDQWCGSNALQMVFNLEKLNNWSFNLNHIDENIPNLQINTNDSISRIDICDMNDANSMILFQILKSVPNLLTYKTSILQYDDMMILEKKCPYLRELYAENFAISALPPSPNSFSKLSIFKSIDVNFEVTLAILAKDEEKRSHFENLVLKNAVGLYA